MQPLIPGQAEIVFTFRPKHHVQEIEKTFGGALDIAAMIQYSYHVCVIGLIAIGSRDSGTNFRENLEQAYSGLAVDVPQLLQWKEIRDAGQISNALAYEALMRRVIHAGLSHVADVQEDLIWLRRLRKQSPLQVGFVVPHEFVTIIPAAATILTGTALTFKGLIKVASEQVKLWTDRTVALSLRDLNKALADKASAEADKIREETALLRAQRQHEDALSKKKRLETITQGIASERELINAQQLDQAPIIQVLRAGFEVEYYQLVQIKIIEPSVHEAESDQK